LAIFEQRSDWRRRHNERTWLMIGEERQEMGLELPVCGLQQRVGVGGGGKLSPRFREQIEGGGSQPTMP
jgi:hypothetical protein